MAAVVEQQKTTKTPRKTASTRRRKQNDTTPDNGASEAELRSLRDALRAARQGDFSVRLPEADTSGLMGEVFQAFNAYIAQNDAMVHEVERVSRGVGHEGDLHLRASLGPVGGSWKITVEALNGLIDNMVWPTIGATRILEAVAEGDLSQTMPLHIDGRPVQGDFLRLGSTVNSMVGRLRSVSSRVSHVVGEIGNEGKLGGQASAEDLSGTWKDLVDDVNATASNLSVRLRDIAQVSAAIANGDLSQKITVDAKGEILELKNTINATVDQLRSFTVEVTRVAREVGTEGKLGGQADVRGVSGVWSELTDSVNHLAGNLTSQVRNIALIATAIAHGDLSQKITVEAKGEILELKDTINAMVDQLRTFAAEVTRVAREVGTEGQLGGQAQVPGVSGTWQELTDNVNLMATNLTDQVRGISRVVTAVANGDLAQKLVLEARGEIATLADTINNMTDALRTFADQVTTVAREVGIEGKLGGQAHVPGVSGTWRELTENVNMLAGNLTNQVRNIALVTTAVAHGDLSQKITVEAKGEISELKNTINGMVEQLRTFAAEVTRVAREVGTEGQLGGQAQVPGVAGTWQELTDNVNLMATNLTNQVRGIAMVVTAVADGDLSQKLVLDARGEIAALADTINNMTDTLRTFADQVTTVAREVGIEGKLGGQARVPGAAGTWRALTDSVNTLAGNLTNQVRNIALVTTAVAHGDLSKQITVEAEGEISELKNTINAMVEQLRVFAAEVTRVAREVGTEGQLGGQAQVPGVSGTWQELTDNVNLMATNLTDQVRGISKVVTAVANGDLAQKLALSAKGEIATLADTINNMTDTLRTFADQVTTMAREVGIEGKLGGQAKVPGAAGTWRDLTVNVNQLAANLTTQVRAISEVATAVTEGDLTRTITVETRGEMLSLKDTINQMIANLRDTTHTNEEQDWLKTNLAKFFSLMQGQRSLKSLTRLVMSELTSVVGAQHGAFYLMEPDAERPVLKLTSSYAYTSRKSLNNSFELGEGLVGQCALERKPIVVHEAPEDYIQVGSGLGRGAPSSIVVFPVLFEEQVRGVIELASFQGFTEIQLNFLEQLMLNIGLAINLIGTSMRTEELLQQLQGSNVELEERRRELEEKAGLLELRNREIADASASLEGKAQELSKVSQYKSQFLANMSHEIRTPLNSMMILAQMLAADESRTLTEQQQEWAETIHAAGRDLLALINQILDLSKVEAGRIETHFERYPVSAVCDFAERTFAPIALQQGLDFQIRVADDVPPDIGTDRQLLEQILKNLLSNAFKFTETGEVRLDIQRVDMEKPLGQGEKNQSDEAVAFTVVDSGIGVPSDKHALIFEAFQQGDPTITRRYGGTGLGLTISREYARILGGEIVLRSTPGKGSTFTLYLPMRSDALKALPAPETLPSGRELAEVTYEDAQALQGRKILLVEDDPRNLYAMTGLLERTGAAVVPAADAREALKLLEAMGGEVDLVLMDIMMPEMDGYEATRQIRAMDGFAGLPIVALTAKASNADHTQCLASGFDDYVVKPVEIRHLMTVIRRHLRA